MKPKRILQLSAVIIFALFFSCGGDDIPEETGTCQTQEFSLKQAKDSVSRGIKQDYYDTSVMENDVSKIFIYEYDVEHTEKKLDFEKQDYNSITYTLLPEDIDKGTWRIGFLCSVYVGSSDIQAVLKSAKGGVPTTRESDYQHSQKEAKEIRDNFLPNAESWEYIFYSKSVNTCSEMELYLIQGNDGNTYNIRIEIDRYINEKYAVKTWVD